jgi:uncharacterized protein (TIRG00374 family)
MIRRKRFWLGLCVSAVFLALFLARTDFEEIRESFAGADYLLAFAAIPLYFVGYWLRTLRWRYLLQPVKSVSTSRLYPITIIGLMANNIAPARIGELVRAYLVGERESISKSTALGTIAVDRAFDGLTLVAILGVVTTVSGTSAGHQSLGIGAAALFFAGTIFLAGLAWSPVRVRGWLLRLSQRMPARLADKAEELIDSFLTGLVAVRSPSLLAKAAVASLASWVMEALMYYAVGEAFHLGVDFDVYLIIAAAANLALSVIASPGGVGPFELATQEVLVVFGVSSAASAAYAIALHALLLGPVILAGFLLIWSAQISLRELLGIPKPAAAPPLAKAGGVE